MKTKKKKIPPELLEALDRAIAELVEATARDYREAREKLLPNPFKFD
jgi:hypothetical protein